MPVKYIKLNCVHKMWRNAQKLVLPFSRRALALKTRLNPSQFAPLYRASMFTHDVPTYSFAKQGKKKKEQIAHQQEREEAETPREIDLQEFESQATKELERFKTEINKIKLGRLSQTSFENIRVLAFGKKHPLSDLVQFVPKNANTMALNVYDESLVTDIVKTLEHGMDNLTMKQEGKTIICQLIGGNTKEMKDALMKQVKAELDKSKDNLKDMRTDAIAKVKKLEKFTSKDAIVKANQEVQNMSEKFVSDLDKAFKAKEKELMSSSM